MLVGLVGCVKTKLERPAPASELYTSELFRGRREAVEGSCDRWFILSALHGLLLPVRVVDPYDLAMKDLPRRERRRWAESVLQDLVRELGSLAGHRFEIHAGADYTDHGLVDGLRRAGADVVQPVAGLTMGQQLSWYSNGATGQPSQLRPTGSSEGRAAGGRRGREAVAGGRYAPLGHYLGAQGEGRVELSFPEIERLLGAPLPASARRHRPWWGNASAGRTQARAWLGAGFEVERVDLRAERVRFVRVR